MSEPGLRRAKYDRILIVDANPATAKLLASALRGLWPAAQVYGARDADMALMLAGEVNPQLAFVDSAGPGLDGMAFTRALRRSDHASREAPIIMIFTEVTAAKVLEARDSGVHEFMRRPYTLGDLQRRVDAVSGHPRDWIEAVAYVGPDRRRFNSADYQGERKRSSDSPMKGQINQALRIVKSAVDQLDSDPAQAARSLAAQARLLIELSAGEDQFKPMRLAAANLHGQLLNILQQGAPLQKIHVASFADGLMQAAPEWARPKAA